MLAVCGLCHARDAAQRWWDGSRAELTQRWQVTPATTQTLAAAHLVEQSQDRYHEVAQCEDKARRDCDITHARHGAGDSRRSPALQHATQPTTTAQLATCGCYHTPDAHIYHQRAITGLDSACVAIARPGDLNRAPAFNFTEE